jgi:ribosome maturation factor RimP
MTSTRDAVVERLRAAAGRVAGSHGLEVFDLQFRREAIGWVLRVMLDRVPETPAGPDAHEDPVSIDDCRRVSEDLSALLDVDDELTEGMAQSYTLEVSSPGLDRPLRGEADYRRFVGRLAKITTHEPIDGQSHFAGRLSGVEEGTVLVAEGRRVHRVPFGAVRRARLDVEF